MEGYALADGLAAPTAQVTLVPPANNGIMLLADNPGWSQEGSTLTITGRVEITNEMLINGDTPIANVTVTDTGVITGGTISASVTNNGTITGGTFGSEVTNKGTVSGGKFNGTFNQSSTAEVTGGEFYSIVIGSGNFGVGCVFGTTANVSSPSFTGQILRTVTVNGVAHGTSVDYKTPVSDVLVNYTLPQGATWQRVLADGSREEVLNGATVGLRDTAFVSSAYYVDGTTLYITSSQEITDAMLKTNIGEDITHIVVTAEGKITGTGGIPVTLPVTVQSGGKISGGTFNNTVSNDGEITGGIFAGTISGAGTFGVDCDFGESASVDEDNFSGAIYRNVSISGRETPVTVEYDGLIVQTLNTAMDYASAAWVKQESDGTSAAATGTDTFTLWPAALYAASPWYVQGTMLCINGETEVPQAMAAGVDLIRVLSGGEITGTGETVQLRTLNVLSGGDI